MSKFTYCPICHFAVRPEDLEVGEYLDEIEYAYRGLPETIVEEG